MFRDRKILAVIPARGGSKRVKNKNIRPFCGKPLIAWTIECARKSKYIDRLILSSDDPEIIKTAKTFNCDVPFVRPKELSGDNVPGVAPLVHAVNEIDGYDYVVLLQTTSPMRSAKDIDNAIELCLGQNAKTCVSVSEVTQNPHWMYEVDDKGRMTKMLSSELIKRSQELPPLYRLNGAVYIAEIEWLKDNGKLVTDDSIAYIMPEGSSVDIDTESDFVMAEYYMENFCLKQMKQIP